MFHFTYCLAINGERYVCPCNVAVTASTVEVNGQTPCLIHTILLYQLPSLAIPWASQ